MASKLMWIAWLSALLLIGIWRPSTERMQVANEWRRPFECDSHECNAEVDHECSAHTNLLQCFVLHRHYTKSNGINASYFICFFFFCAFQFANGAVLHCVERIIFCVEWHFFLWLWIHCNYERHWLCAMGTEFSHRLQFIFIVSVETVSYFTYAWNPLICFSLSMPCHRLRFLPHIFYFRSPIAS